MRKVSLFLFLQLDHMHSTVREVGDEDRTEYHPRLPSNPRDDTKMCSSKNRPQCMGHGQSEPTITTSVHTSGAREALAGSTVEIGGRSVDKAGFLACLVLGAARIPELGAKPREETGLLWGLRLL